MPEGIDKLREVAKSMERGLPLYRQGLKRCDLVKAIKEYDDLEDKYEEVQSNGKLLQIPRQE